MLIVVREVQPTPRLVGSEQKRLGPRSCCWQSKPLSTPMAILQVSHAQGRRLLLIAFCALPLLPHPSAQTGEELMADACYNELHQREQNALWESRVQRRNGGHVIREQEIETVDGLLHRLLSVDRHEPSPSESKQNDERLHDF